MAPLDPGIILQQKSPLDVQREFAQVDQLKNQTALGQQELQQNAQMNPLKIQQAKQAMQSGQLDMLKQKNDMVSQVLFGVNDEDTYQRAKQWAKSNGLDVSRLPNNYDPGVINQLRMSSMTTAQYLNNMYKMAGLDLNAAKTFGSVDAGQQAMSQMGIGGGMMLQPQGTLAQPVQPMQGPMQNGQTLQSAMPPMPAAAPQAPLQTLAAQKMAQQGDLGAQRIDIAKQNLALREKQMTGGMMPDDRKDALAQAIANGQMQAPTSYALAKSPDLQDVMGRVLKMNPNFDSNANANIKQFETGKLGSQVRSFNVGIAHLDTLSKLADALDNGDYGMVNKIANEFARQTGGTAPTNFDTAKQIVGDEIVKAVVGAGGGVQDREHAQDVISRANSPAQLKGAIETYKTLMQGQLGGLQQQYEQSTGRKDFQRFLTPAAKAEEGAQSQNLPVFSDPNDPNFQALPSGAQFRTNDGQIRTKH